MKAKLIINGAEVSPLSHQLSENLSLFVQDQKLKAQTLYNVQNIEQANQILAKLGHTATDRVTSLQFGVFF